ncbi:hypothetical protein QEP73_19870 [Pseudomonas defluvii]|nr:hypothetical protein QEP73_19870 [Pseudomonas defluvii]
MAKIDAETLLARMEQGDELMAQAFESLRRYEEAKGVLDVDEVKQLRIQAESFFEAVQAYQLRALGGEAPVLH